MIPGRAARMIFDITRTFVFVWVCSGIVVSLEQGRFIVCVELVSGLNVVIWSPKLLYCVYPHCSSLLSSSHWSSTSSSVDFALFFTITTGEIVIKDESSSDLSKFRISDGRFHLEAYVSKGKLSSCTLTQDSKEIDTLLNSHAEIENIGTNCSILRNIFC